jgi:hypothetical protein
MKRKIEKYMAKKHGIAEDKLALHEEGRFDFQGEVEEVLRAVRGKELLCKGQKDHDIDDHDDCSPITSSKQASSGLKRSHLKNSKSLLESHDFFMKKARFEHDTNAFVMGRSSYDKENIRPRDCLTNTSRYFPSPSLGRKLMNGSNTVLDETGTYYQDRDPSSRHPFENSKYSENLWQGMNDREQGMNPLDPSIDHSFPSKDIRDILCSPGDGEKLYQMIRSPDESCNINGAIHGMTPLSVLKDSDFSKTPFSSGKPLRLFSPSSNAIFDDLKSSLFSPSIESVRGKNLGGSSTLSGDKIKVDTSDMTVNTCDDESVDHGSITESTANFFSQSSYKRLDSVVVKPTPSLSRSFREVAVSPISQNPQCKRNRRSNIFDSTTSPVSLGTGMMNVSFDDTPQQKSVCLGVLPLRALMAASPAPDSRVLLTQISPSVQPE